MDIYKDQPVDIVATFRSRAGALTDPPAVTYELRAPSGQVTVFTLAQAQVVRDSLGVFRLTTRPATSGTWAFRVEGAEPIPGVVEGRFIVRPSVF